MARAVQHIANQHPDLLDRLYNDDNVHPSPLATWLQACRFVALASRWACAARLGGEHDGDHDNDTSRSNYIGVV
jgi:hypothetical protein